MRNGPSPRCQLSGGARCARGGRSRPCTITSYRHVMPAQWKSLRGMRARRGRAWWSRHRVRTRQSACREIGPPVIAARRPSRGGLWCRPTRSGTQSRSPRRRLQPPAPKIAPVPVHQPSPGGQAALVSPWKGTGSRGMARRSGSPRQAQPMPGPEADMDQLHQRRRRGQPFGDNEVKYSLERWETGFEPI